ncbi:SDR family oxidoreductase [Kitasatospora sp. NPDC088134]|uniref:SDR family oxidoreductase n=1 Tax=Kitasatospora sp. NPDC088134 TaxID=3364071 RepID=UPI0037FBC5D5
MVLLSSAAVLAEGAAEDPLGSHNLRVEQALLASGLPCTLLRADSFASNALAWAHSIGRGLPIELPYPEAALAVVYPEDLAEVAFAALTGREPRGRAVTVTGGESLTLRRQLAVLAEVLGREIPVETTGRAAAAEQLGRHLPAAFVESLLTYWAAASGGAPAALGDTTRTLLDCPERTFREWAAEHAGEFTAH